MLLHDNPDSTPTKQCSSCKRDLPAAFDYFGRDIHRKSGMASACKDCERERFRKYRAEHPEKAKATTKKYYDANREKMAEYRRQYAAANPGKATEASRKSRAANFERAREVSNAWAEANREKTRVASRKHYYAHRDELLERQKEYYKNHPNKRRVAVQKYANANREKIRVIASRRRARKHHVPDALVPADWQRALDYFGSCCAVCNQSPDLFHIISIDHWIALSDPDCPGNTRLNVVPLCISCNASKKSDKPENWLKSKFGKRKAAAILARIEAYFEWVKEQAH